MEPTLIAGLVEAISNTVSTVVQSGTDLVLQNRAYKEGEKDWKRSLFPDGSFWERNRVESDNSFVNYAIIGLVAVLAIIVAAAGFSKK